MFPMFHSILKTRILTSFLAGLFGWLALASAQEAPKSTCRILFLDGPDDAPETLHLFDGATSREVDLPRMNFSRVYELPPGELTLRLLPTAPVDPSAIPSGAPAVKVPATVSDFYLLVTSDPANPVAPVRMSLINANADRLRRGQMLWYNLTDKAVGGVLGSEKVAIKPGSRVVVDPPATGAVNYPVNLSYRIAANDALYPLCETQWLHDPRSRSVAFIVGRPGVRTPRVLVFPDYREEEPE